MPSEVVMGVMLYLTHSNRRLMQSDAREMVGMHLRFFLSTKSSFIVHFFFFAVCLFFYPLSFSLINIKF